jgi:acylphosphatase
MQHENTTLIQRQRNSPTNNKFMSTKCLQIRVYGKVQGVWYRGSTKQKADELGLSGLVRNQSDGSVYIEACGEEAVLQQLIDWCWRGPELARVSQVEVGEMVSGNYVGFEVRR